MLNSTCALAGCLRRALLASACLLWAASPGGASDWRSVHDQASALKAAGNYEGAISVLRAFIARGGGGDHLALATVCNNLGAAYHALGRCEESKTAHQRALRHCEQSGNAAAMVAGAMDFASALLDCGAHGQAAQLVRRVLEPRMGGFTPLLRGRTLLLLANAQMHRRRYGEAESLFRAALALKEGEKPNYQAVMLGAAARHGLAMTLASSGRKHEAIAELRQATALLEHAGQPALVAQARTLHNLAALHHELKQYDEAESTYVSALAAAAAAFGGGENPTLGIILTSYSNHLRARGRKSDANDARQRAQAILANTRSHGTVDIEDLRAESGRKR
jgi:tetratricopeptide (TPR) repeat protein